MCAPKHREHGGRNADGRSQPERQRCAAQARPEQGSAPRIGHRERLGREVCRLQETERVGVRRSVSDVVGRWNTVGAIARPREARRHRWHFRARELDGWLVRGCGRATERQRRRTMRLGVERISAHNARLSHLCRGGRRTGTGAWRRAEFLAQPLSSPQQIGSAVGQAILGDEALARRPKLP